MTIKPIIIALLVILLIVSMSQLLPIAPYSETIFGLYKSGYFSELDTGFSVIRDAFLSIKMLSNPAYAWIFIDDMRKGHGMDIRIYNHKGELVPAPDETRPGTDADVVRILNSLKPGPITKIRGNRYYAALPLPRQERCVFCHNRSAGNSMIGVMTFERPYNGAIYYAAERIIIFSVIALALAGLLIVVWRWDPERRVKELFDKK